MPVGVVACQARHLQPQHDARVAQTDLRDQLLKALAIGDRSSRLSQIAVDDDHPFRRPAQGHRLLTQGVLPVCALGVLEHLPQRRLTHI